MGRQSRRETELLDLRGSIPSWVVITDGKIQDVNLLDPLVFEAEAF